MRYAVGQNLYFINRPDGKKIFGKIIPHFEYHDFWVPGDVIIRWEDGHANTYDKEWLDENVRPTNEDCNQVQEPERTVTFNYLNWKGSYDRRRITPLQIWFGSNDFHKVEQWMMDAYDHDKKALRTFAMKDISGWTDHYGERSTWK